MHKGNVVAEKDGYKVLDCEICGFKHLDPIPSDEQIKDYYQNKYYQQKTNRLLDPEKEAKEIEWAGLAYNDELVVIKQHCVVDSGSILDVGCGNGFFLDFMRRHKWDAYGIEPSIEAKKHADSLASNVFNVSIEDFVRNIKWHGFFDVVHLKDVLEHIPDPASILKICKNLLKPNGMIYVEVPNDFNCFQSQICKTNKPKWWIAPPDHINYFNFDSMEKLLVNAGFEAAFKTTGFCMEMFILMGDDYINNPEVGSICHQKRMLFELSISDELRRSIYASLAKLGIGRSCILYAKLKR